MRRHICRRCGGSLFFENSVCVSCGTDLGYSRAEGTIVPVDAGRYVDADGVPWYVCRNLNLSGCTWLTAEDGGQCEACDLTRTRPNDADVVGLVNFLPSERAKRHLLAELDILGFPVVNKADDSVNGLCFDLLSSVAEDVITGHAEGVVTIDLAEADNAHREQVKSQLNEVYRTMLGHFRHEVGHYMEWQLVENGGDDVLARARELFRDETVDYQETIDRHYREGPPEGWEESYISAYATMHPYEDFAETWAHYLHICDTIQTCVEFGLVAEDTVTVDGPFRDLVTGVWMPQTTALNMVNRSMGKDDLYPFVIPAPVLDKLEFVASLRPAA
ncbi:zinc-binding metallopeptidase family protein [Corynebacterium terpenotabidum]|uniref:zinc-binding metallopeptidase family protein n=1 Tax=Corynebacterium terpenotabidum TaxID=89154 RepID=UPI00059FF817|nr:putative zinc-binding metallopeptidase [Corynebacterium terpenotabidum]